MSEFTNDKKYHDKICNAADAIYERLFDIVECNITTKRVAKQTLDTMISINEAVDGFTKQERRDVKGVVLLRISEEGLMLEPTYEDQTAEELTFYKF